MTRLPKQQNVVEQSLMQVQYVQMALFVCETFWLPQFVLKFWKVLLEDTCDKTFETKISRDNQVCNADARSSAVSDMCRVIDLKFQLVVNNVKMVT